MAERKNSGARRNVSNSAANLMESLKNEQKIAEVSEERAKEAIRELETKQEEKPVMLNPKNGPVEETKTSETQSGKKPKTKAQRIAEMRPMQVSVHFTVEEKSMLESIKYKLKLKGFTKATVEDIIHDAVLEWFDNHGKNPEINEI